VPRSVNAQGLRVPLPAPALFCSAVADLQHSGQFGWKPQISPCLHTIRYQDLGVLLEGFEDELTGRFFLNAERPPPGRGGLFFHELSGQGCRGMG